MPPLFDGTINALEKGKWALLLDLIIDDILFFSMDGNKIGFCDWNESDERVHFREGVTIGEALGSTVGTIQYTADSFYGRTTAGWILLGSSNAGDMLKAVYDTNDNGIVDRAEALSDGVLSITFMELYNYISDTKVLEGPGNPNGVVTGAVGQTYRDTVSGFFYKNDDGSTVWSVI